MSKWETSKTGSGILGIRDRCFRFVGFYILLPLLLSGAILVAMFNLSIPCVSSTISLFIRAGFAIFIYLGGIFVIRTWYDFFYFYRCRVNLALGILYVMALLSNCATQEPGQRAQQFGHYRPVPKVKEEPAQLTAVQPSSQQPDRFSAVVQPPLQIEQRNLVTSSPEQLAQPTVVLPKSALREALSAREEALADAQTSATQAGARAELLESDLGTARTEMAALRAEQSRLGVALAQAETKLALVKPAHRNAEIRLFDFRLLDLSAPGTIFALFAATVTVLGFTITITRLEESHVRISSYEELLERLGRLLKDTSDSPPDREGLKILCTVPNLGNLSHPRLSLREVYPRLKEVINCETVRIDIVCIDASLPPVLWNDIKTEDYAREDFKQDNGKNALRLDVLNKGTSSIAHFYRETFKNKRHFEDYQLLQGMLEAIDIFLCFDNRNTYMSMVKYLWEGATDSPPVHLFWTRKRAIVSVPLDRGVSESTGDGPGVTMVGYQTTDPTTIENLLVVYEEWRDDIGRKDEEKRNKQIQSMSTEPRN